MRIFRYLAALGLALSILMHLVTFFGEYPAHWWLLFAGVLVLFVPFVIAAGGMAKETPGENWPDRVSSLVPRFEAIGFCLWLYAAFNLVCLYVLREGGRLDRVDGVPVLRTHDIVLRILTPREEEWQKAYFVRAASAGFMLAYIGGTRPRTQLLFPFALFVLAAFQLWQRKRR
jgi:hypothetical protein